MRGRQLDRRLLGRGSAVVDIRIHPVGIYEGIN
jgi:hypothetical protein